MAVRNVLHKQHFSWPALKLLVLIPKSCVKQTC